MRALPFADVAYGPSQSRIHLPTRCHVRLPLSALEKWEWSGEALSGGGGALVSALGLISGMPVDDGSSMYVFEPTKTVRLECVYRIANPALIARRSVILSTTSRSRHPIIPSGA